MDLSGLRRSTTNRRIAGVAAGVAQYVGLDPRKMRIAWAVAAIFGGGIVLYVILWILLPEGASTTPALRIAEERFAWGEIGAEELRQIRNDLGWAL